jgi:hypothetical protein
MNKIILFYLLIANLSFSQKELWGVNNDTFVPLSNAIYYGNITKYNINGQNPVKMHEFNITDGRNPTSKLFQASNGKIYGTTSVGGTFYPFADYGAGVLFEYDLILNKYTVAHYFDFPNGPPNATLFGTGLIEPIVNILYGMNNQKPYSFNIITAEYLTGSTFTEYAVIGELMKGSNGFLYGTTSYANPCPTVNPLNNQPGTIFKINTQTLALQTVFRFNCDKYSRFKSYW